jgi:hypothetical protein
MTFLWLVRMITLRDDEEFAGIALLAASRGDSRGGDLLRWTFQGM